MLYRLNILYYIGTYLHTMTLRNKPFVEFPCQIILLFGIIQQLAMYDFSIQDV